MLSAPNHEGAEELGIGLTAMNLTLIVPGSVAEMMPNQCRRALCLLCQVKA